MGYIKYMILSCILGCFLLASTSCSSDSDSNESDKKVPSLEESTRPIIITEQDQHRILIVDSVSQKTMWEWKVSTSGLPPNHQGWLNAPSEVKPIYNKKYILMTGGKGVAIIRVSDKKVMFYAYPRGNPHSAEILPDGHLVVASSNAAINGNLLHIYRVDTLQKVAIDPIRSYPLRSGHNVVWDKEKDCLYATDLNQLNCYSYNYDVNDPQLNLEYSIPLPGTGYHDLFPVYGKKRTMGY